MVNSSATLLCQKVATEAAQQLPELPNFGQWEDFRVPMCHPVKETKKISMHTGLVGVGGDDDDDDDQDYDSDQTQDELLLSGAVLQEEYTKRN